MGQTVMRFSSAAARTAALTTPVAGMQSYQTDTGLTYQYTGAAWVPLNFWVKKAASESVTSSITMQDDNDFTVALAVGSYRVEAFLHATGNTAGDLSVQWVFSGTAGTSSRSCIGPGIASTDATAIASFRSSGHNITTAVDYGLDTGTSNVINEDLFLVVTVAGTLKMQWAQRVSSATATTLSTASRMYVNKLA